MAQTGFTPLQLYHSVTPAATPSAVNLAIGELAANLADKKLFTKDGGGTVIELTPSATNILAVAAGGTGSGTQSGARTNLGATTLGANLFTFTDPSAVTFLRINADNTVSALNAADFRTAIGVGSNTGDVTGPGSSVSGNIATFNGTTGKVLQDGGKALPTGDVVGTSDTQTLTNKTLTSPDTTQNVQVIGTNTNAVRSRTYVITASLTLTLPASPAAGDWVSVINRSGTTTPVIARNGSNIMGLAEDLTLDSANAPVTLVYADATRGWVIS